MDDVQTAKQQARSRVRARRRDLVEAQGAAGRATQASGLASAFLTWAQQYAEGLGHADLAGLVVTAFRPLPSEPPVGHLVQALLEADTQVLLPVTVRGEPDLRWTPATRATGDGDPAEVMHGTRPTGAELGPEALREVDIALIPGLAVDAGGMRLGQGGGYYDRALPLVRPEVPVIVALHDHESPAHAGPDVLVPRAPHDIPVDGVLTTDGVTLLT